MTGRNRPPARRGPNQRRLVLLCAGTLTLLALFATPARSIEHPAVPGEQDMSRQQDAGRYATEGPVAIPYDLPTRGFVTLVIEGQTGKRIRNLIGDYPRAAGRNVDYWDGLDDEGRLAAPGQYRVRGLFHQGLDVRYAFSFGNPSMPPWPSADGRGGWLANHTNPMTVLADEERIYVSAPESEGPHPLIALDYDGNQVWGGLSRWHAGYMAREGDDLYVVNEQDARPLSDPADLDKPARIELIRIDPESGRERPFPDGQSRHEIARWDIARLGAAKQWEGATIEHHAHDADWAGLNAAGMAALAGNLYVSLHFEDKLLRIDARTGQVTGEIPLPKPAGLAADGKRLLAISGKSIIALDPVDETVTPIVRAHLAAPIDLATDSKGNIYASDWADQMCVKVFSPEGEYRGHIGRMGGRPWRGPYEASGMLLPRGISIDGRDRLWVAEYDFSPRRISAWDTATGGLLIERVGRGRYGGMGYYILPDDPRQGILLNNLVELDWDNARWRIAGTLWRGTRENEVLGFDPYTRLARVIHRDGRRLLVHTSLRPWGGPIIISELTPSGLAKPLAAIGPVSSALPHVAQRWQGGFEPTPIFAAHLWTAAGLNAATRKVLPWLFEGPLAGDPRLLYRGTAAVMDQARAGGLSIPGGRLAPNANFVWSDLDADGGADPGEIQYFATPALAGPSPAQWQPEQWSGGVVGDDLAMYLTAIQDDRAFHYRLPVSQWTAAGAPVYEPAAASLITASPYMGQAAWLSAEGNLLTLANIPGKGRPERQRDPLVMFRPDGSIAWTYPSPWTGVHGSHTALKERRGQLVGPLGVLGTTRIEGVGEIFAFHTNLGTAELFTADGLYLGRIFRDTRAVAEPWPARPYRGQSLIEMTNGGEWFGGQLFQHPDGRTFVVASRHAGVIAEVTGLETTCRLDVQPVELTPSLYARAQERLAPTATGARPERAIRISRVSGANGKPPALTAFRWDADHAAQWRYDDTRSARATWAWDRTHLYVAFQVEDDTPMINGGEDVRQLFKSGDAAILEFRTNPDPDRANHAPRLPLPWGERAKVRGNARAHYNTQSPTPLLSPSPLRGEGRGEGSERSERNQPAPGDLRLLFSVHQGNPVAVLYDYRRPRAKDPVEFTSVKTTRIDRVEVIEDAAIIFDRNPTGYTLRAAVPLAALDNWAPTPGETYPGDFGVVYSDATGTTNVLRMHWSNPATGIVSDLSLEADIQPSLWGKFDIQR